MPYTPAPRTLFVAAGQWAWAAHLSRDCPFLRRARTVLEMPGDGRVERRNHGRHGTTVLMWFRVPDRTRELALCDFCRKRHAAELADAFRQ